MEFLNFYKLTLYIQNESCSLARCILSSFFIIFLHPFFKEENCSVLLTFPSHNDTIYRSYKINTAKIYGNGSELVVSDFENGFNPNFTNFFQSTCLKKIDNPIVTTKTAILPKLFFLRGLKRKSSSRPPKTPDNKMLKITEVEKFIPNGENLSRYNKVESGEDEKKRAIIAPKAIISP